MGTSADMETIDSIISYLNQEMYEESPPYITQFLEENEISFMSNGNIIIVKFLGVELWNSDDDPRETFEDSGEPVVNLKDFIKGKILETIDTISKIKLGQTWST